MPRYIVSVVRIGYGGRDLEIEAEDEAAAKEVAMDCAGEEHFIEHSSDYEVDHIECIDEQ